MELLRRIETYLERSGARPTNFGRAAIRDPSLVRDLRRGRELRPETAARIRAFLDKVEEAA